MFPDESVEIDYDKFMEWLSSQRLCCITNPSVRVYDHPACWDCFRAMRPAVTDIHINFEETSIRHIIKWDYLDS